VPSNSVKYFTCIHCGAEFIFEKPDDIHTKVDKHKINRADIETLHKCNECDKNSRIYRSEQQRPH
jgi:hypothetical protein